ncbi:hypothetical protein V498_10508 [Pseudogymnoascus sp. VKM F-4517 (FW-2822)]|nr:hypothetical protein V498_10508 [Pseudogymnoascus sp. VKM F-4517 (FW-2822)]
MAVSTPVAVPAPRQRAPGEKPMPLREETLRKNTEPTFTADREERTSFASVKEDRSAVAQSFLESNISSYATFPDDAIDESDSDRATSPTSPTDLSLSSSPTTTDDDNEGASAAAAPATISITPAAPAAPNVPADSQVPSQLMASALGAPLTNPASTLHSFVCPCDGFRGWKEIPVRGKMASRSFSDLRQYSNKGFTWEPTPILRPIQPPKPLKPSTFPAGEAPLEKLPTELLDGRGHPAKRPAAAKHRPDGPPPDLARAALGDARHAVQAGHHPALDRLPQAPAPHQGIPRPGHDRAPPRLLALQPHRLRRDCAAARRDAEPDAADYARVSGAAAEPARVPGAGAHRRGAQRRRPAQALQQPAAARARLLRRLLGHLPLLHDDLCALPGPAGADAHHAALVPRVHDPAVRRARDAPPAPPEPDPPRRGAHPHVGQGARVHPRDGAADAPEPEQMPVALRRRGRGLPHHAPLGQGAPIPQPLHGRQVRGAARRDARFVPPLHPPRDPQVAQPQRQRHERHAPLPARAADQTRRGARAGQELQLHLPGPPPAPATRHQARRTRALDPARPALHRHLRHGPRAHRLQRIVRQGHNSARRAVDAARGDRGVPARVRPLSGPRADLQGCGVGGQGGGAAGVAGA